MAVLCDNILQESNGKPLLIGIYTGGITVATPSNILEGHNAVLNLSLWLPFRIPGTGKVSIEVKIIGPSTENTMMLKGQILIEHKPSSYEIAAFNFIGLTMLVGKEGGELKILFRNEGEKKWTTLNIVPVNTKLI